MMPLSWSSLPFWLVVRALEGRGYELTWQRQAWVECLVTKEPELWHGRGSSEDAALRQALAQMFPSSAAQAVLVESLVSLPELAPTAAAAGRLFEEAVALEIVAEKRPDQAPVEAGPDPFPAAAESLPVGSEQPAPMAAAGPPGSVRHHEAELFEAAGRVLEDLQVTLAHIDAMLPDLAVSSPRRQRLVMTAWMARTRDAQRLLPDDNGVREASEYVVRTLSRCAKSWWPGNIRALQRSTVPEDYGADRDLGFPRGLRSWGDLAEAADEALSALDVQEQSRGVDQYGWSDSASLSPRPEAPDERLLAVSADMELVGGSLGGLAAGVVPEAASLSVWAQQLRWLRNAVSDAAAWGAAMGRLRFWASRVRAGASDLSDLIDPAHVPPGSWASLVLAREKSTAWRELLSKVPRPGQAAQLESWLRRALAFVEFVPDEVVLALEPHRDAVLAINVPKILSGSELRGARRALLRIQQTLSGGTDVHAGPAEPAPPDVVVPAFAPAPSILERTRGRKALFVSNRADLDLRDRVREVFEFASLDWVVIEPRRLEAGTQGIVNGRYELVLAATGFMAHKADKAIAEACRSAGVPYIRANHGRPVACAQAIARELGLAS